MITPTQNPEIDIITENNVDFDSLTIQEQIDYMEAGNILYFMDRQKRKAEREAREAKKQKTILNKLVCMRGIL